MLFTCKCTHMMHPFCINLFSLLTTGALLVSILDTLGPAATKCWGWGICCTVTTVAKRVSLLDTGELLTTVTVRLLLLLSGEMTVAPDDDDDDDDLLKLSLIMLLAESTAAEGCWSSSAACRILNMLLAFLDRNSAAAADFDITEDRVLVIY